MSVPFTPFKPRTGWPLSVDQLNGNLEAAARDIQESLDARYSYSTIVHQVDGVADTSTVGERRIPIRVPADTPLDIIGVEVVLYGTGAVTVTISSVSSTIAGWEDVAVTMAGATTKAKVSADFVAKLSAGTTHLLNLAFSGAGTITRGDVIFHVRGDRGNAAASPNHAGYTRTVFTAATTDDAGNFNTEFTNIAAAVARDLANDHDVRAGRYVKRNVAAGTAAAERVWRIPSSGRRIAELRCYAVVAIGTTVTWTLADELGATLATAAAAGLGTLLMATGVATPNDVQSVDDPIDRTDDYTLTVSVTGASTALQAACDLWET